MSEIEDLRKKLADLEWLARCEASRTFSEDLKGLQFKLRVEYNVPTGQLVLRVDDVRAAATDAVLHSSRWENDSEIFENDAVFWRHDAEVVMCSFANPIGTWSREMALKELKHIQKKAAPATVTLDVAAADEGLSRAQRALDAAKTVAEEIAG